MTKKLLSALFIAIIVLYCLPLNFLTAYPYLPSGNEQTIASNSTASLTQRTLSNSQYSSIGQILKSTTGTYNVTKFALKIASVSGSTGTIKAQIFENGNSATGVPIGSPVAESSAIAVTALATGFFNISFPSGFLMEDNTYYAVVWNGDSLDGSTVILDLDSSYVYPNGEYAVYVIPTGWTTVSTRDCNFYLYGIPLGASHIVSSYTASGGSMLINGTAAENGTQTDCLSGNTLNFTAVPSDYFAFSHFESNAGSSSSNPYYLTVSENDTVWAYFESAIGVTFSITAGGTLTANDVSYSNGETIYLASGSDLTLAATPSASYHLHSYAYDSVEIYTNPYTFQPTSNMTLTVTFKTAPYITFYKNAGTFSVNGASVTNGTTTQYDVGDILTLEGSDFIYLRDFSNYTFSYGSVVSENPHNYMVSAQYDDNFTITLYDYYHPQAWQPQFPNEPAGLQYIYTFNLLGFFQAYFENLMGQAFWAFIMIIFYVGLYLRTKSLAAPSVCWILMGGFWSVLSPVVAPFAYFFTIMGIAGAIFQAFSHKSEN